MKKRRPPQKFHGGPVSKIERREPRRGLRQSDPQPHGPVKVILKNGVPTGYKSKVARAILRAVAEENENQRHDLQEEGDYTAPGSLAPSAERSPNQPPYAPRPDLNASDHVGNTPASFTTEPEYTGNSWTQAQGNSTS